MLKNLVFAVLAAAIVLGAGYAQQVTVKVAPISSTSVSDGKQMFMNYCAPCHGVNGQGDGPVASSLKQRPVNLTFISRNHSGNFPFSHVTSILEFGIEDDAHGTAAMPVWGPMFTQGDPRSTKDAEKRLRIHNLTNYVRSIQVQ